MAIRQINGERISIDDFFRIGDVAAPLLGMSALLATAVMIGAYMCYIPGFILSGLFMFAPALVVDRKLKAVDALTTSFNMLKSNWLMATLFYFVISLLSGLGVLACCVGVLVTVPLMYLSVAVGYQSFLYGQQTPGYAPDYGQQAAGTWPPPPGQQPPYGQQHPYQQPPPEDPGSGT